MSDAHDETEARYAEGDAAAWARPLRESELFFPERRDLFNFIDETKVAHLRPLLPPGGHALGDREAALDFVRRQIEGLGQTDAAREVERFALVRLVDGESEVLAQGEQLFSLILAPAATS